MNENLKRNLAIGGTTLVALYLLYGIFSGDGSAEVIDSTNTVKFICSETGRVFPIELTKDTPGFPLENPKTGNNTLWPAEMCYWDECGPKGGTAVLMNTFKDEKEPTHCPVCGHLVRFRNPKPPNYGSNK